MKRYILIFAIGCVHYGFAQSVWKADLPVVEKSDYYNIELDQELVGAGLKYLKIIDANGNEVPYFVRSDNPIREITDFENFVLRENRTKDSLNIIIVDNKTLENLNRFCIVIQRAETKKFIALRGSNDLKQWYIVKQQTGAPEFSKKSGENTEMVLIDFPQGNYRYYEITLWNDQKSPLEVLKVGKIKNSNLYGHFTAIHSGQFVVENNRETQNTSISFPELKHTCCINKIEFDIQHKPDYYRQAALIDSIPYRSERFLLSSGNDNTLLFNDFFFTPQTFIQIENRNNPPVVIDSIRLFGLCRYACLYLEAGRNYHVLLDPDDKISAAYDIEHFRNQIPADLAILKIINLRDYEQVAFKRELTLIEKPLFLWSVIMVVGVFLVFICFRMMKEMKKNR
jgi:hypothetical protein